MKDLRGKVIWLIGLPNSGKSTIAEALRKSLVKNFPYTILLDGDHLRLALQMTDSNFDLQSRTQNGYRVGRIAQMFTNQNLCVIVAANTLFHEVQQWNRLHLNYFEVYISTDESTRRARDSEKKIYARYDNGELKNILGVDIEPQLPSNPDLIIENNLNSNIDDHVQMIINSLV